jgi:uncharacterized protein
MATDIVHSPFKPEDAVQNHFVAARAPWSGVVRKGQWLRIIDLAGQQSADTLFYAADNFAERYSAQDTLHAQSYAYIRAGTPILSNEGRVMLTVTADTSGDHDTSAGACSCESNTVRFGHHTKYMHACRENFLVELAKHGMSKRDIVSNINFFMNVPVTPQGALSFADGISGPGRYVQLRAEMNVLVLISNCPQLNNPCNAYNPTPAQILIWAAG